MKYTQCIPAFLLSGALLASSVPLLAQGEWSGFVAAETRAFASSPLFEGQERSVSAALILQAEYYREWQDGDLAFEAIPYVRADSADSERDLLDLREFSLLKIMGDWEIRLGISKVFWGVAESQHLVDTINQSDAVANPDLEDKLGQPMAQIVYVSNFGDFSFFALPYFRERTFPGEEGRLRSGLVVDADAALYQSDDEERHVDYALRWFNIVGDFDIGLHYFRGTNRDPSFVPNLTSSGLALRPYYAQMDQVGLDLQYTRESWLWKLEALARDSDDQRYEAAVGGFEYTLYGIMGSAKDLGLLVEGHWDSRGEQAGSPFNRDIFLGGRLSWNDEADSALVAGVISDLDSGTLFATVEFEKRIGSSMKLELELRAFENVDSSDLFFDLRDDSFLQLSLSRFW